MYIDAQGVISWTPVVVQTAPVTAVVEDGYGHRVTQKFTVEVAYDPGNLPPVFAAVQDQNAPLGDTLVLQLSATDPEGATITYDASPMPLPNNMAFDTHTGTLRFTPAVTQVGTHGLVVSASDGRFHTQQSLTITVPEPVGVTQLYGRVLSTADTPLPGVRLEIAGVEVTTDENGDYLLDNIPASGSVRLLVDGSSVDISLGQFATVPEQIELIPGARNHLTPPIYLLPLDIASADTVNPTQISMITSSPMSSPFTDVEEPVTLMIPPGMAINDQTGQPFVGDISISAIHDPALGPRPLPEDIGLSVYIAIQPFGVSYPEPVPISFPNLENFPPGSRMDFFGLNHDTGEFEKVGEGLVSSDGQTIDSIGGVVHANSWHGVVPQPPMSEPGSDSSNSSSGSGCGSGGGGPGAGSGDSGSSGESGACVINKETGNLSESHTLPTYYSLQRTRTLTLEYNTNAADPSPILPLVTGFGNQAPPPDSMSLNLSVGGVITGRTLHSEVRIEPSNIRGQFEPTRQSLQFDASAFSTGLYDYEIDIACYFPISRRSETVTGEVIVNNAQDSVFGAGWALRGLQRLYEGHVSGRVLLTDGSSNSMVFTPVSGQRGAFTSPGADFSILSRQTDGTLERRMPNGDRYRFDRAGLLVEMLDRNDNSTRYRYDVQQRLIEILDPTGKFYSLQYSNEKINRITDPLGRITQFEHDAAGNLVTVIEPNGDRRSFEYQSGQAHLMSAQTDQRGNTKRYEYDFSGRVKRAHLPDGSTLSFQISHVIGLLDSDAETASPTQLADGPPLNRDVENIYIDPNGNRVIQETDDRNYPTRVTDFLHRTTTIERDENSLPVSTTRPNGSIMEKDFDALGNILRIQESFNQAAYNYTYDKHSLLTKITNPRGHTTNWIRDEKGNATSITNHLGHTTTMSYDTRGLVTRMVDPVGLDTAYFYNNQGLVERVVETPPANEAGNVKITQYSYDEAGQNTQTITPDGIVMTFVYDAKGRLSSVTDNLGQQIRMVYDAYNNLIKTDSLNRDSSLALTLQQYFDNRNRLERIAVPHTDDEDSITRFGWDKNNNSISVTDPNGNTESDSYDRADRKISNVHRLSGTTRYAYDTRDQVTEVVAPNSVTTRYEYDLLARRTKESSSDRGEIRYSYDLVNNLTRMTDARGIVVDYIYDELERLVSKTFPDSSENVTYTYDNCPYGTGRLCGVEDESGTYSYAYDAHGNVVSMTKVELSQEYVTRYRYDNGDNLIGMTYPSGRAITINRDGVRRVDSIGAEINGSDHTVANGITYRGDNRLLSCTIGNGLQESRSYDLQGRLVSQNTGAIDSRNYSYDANGNILSRTTTPQDSGYQYDALDRLIDDRIKGGTSDSYGYDLNGNRTSRVRNDLEMTRYDYSPDSNRLNFVEKRFRGNNAVVPVQPSQTRTYNDANRWDQLFIEGALKATYIHNAMGQRTRKVVVNTDNTISTTVYHYDFQGMLISETNERGEPIKDYIWLDYAPIAQIEYDAIADSDTIYYLHTDHLMTPRFATDSGGNIVWRWEGEAFGDTLSKSDPDGNGKDVVVNLRFAGQYFDQETDLHYNYFRTYDPTTGRYTQSDPIGLNGGFNTYGYVQGNPLYWSDIYGLFGASTFFPAHTAPMMRNPYGGSTNSQIQHANTINLVRNIAADLGYLSIPAGPVYVAFPIKSGIKFSGKIGASNFPIPDEDGRFPAIPYLGNRTSGNPHCK